MSKPPTTRGPVCVTGASGFIASHLIQQLLTAGYQVTGSIRKTKSDYPHLTELSGADQRLRLISAQLLEEGSFDHAVKGCHTVMHTASPYSLTVADPQRDLVDPAVMGTTHVLKSCARAESVRRVVLTSSVAAITDEPDSNHVYTEEDWNEKSSLSRNPYYYSKTLAERAAWDFVKKQKPDFDLVVINPFLVIGPAMTETINTSNHVVLNLLNGSYPGIVNLAWGFVDVRDVARAHILAMETEQAGGRYLCANVTLSMSQVLDIFRQEGFGNYKLPTLALNGKMGNLLMRAGSYFQSKGVASYLRTHIGNVAYFDHSKIKRELGVEFAAIGKTLKDTIEDLIKWSHLPDRR